MRTGRLGYWAKARAGASRNAAIKAFGMRMAPSSGTPSNPGLEPVGDLVKTGMLLDYSQNARFELPVRIAPPRFKPIPATVKKQVDDQERGALVAVREAVISRQRFRQRGGFSVDGTVIPRERPADRRFEQAPIPHAGQAAETKRLLVGFDDVLDSDPKVPYGVLTLRQALQ
jgi:hypothetical protein